MNIPEHILQQVADEAFLPSSKIVLTTSNIFDDWKNQAKDRRAVIQHAISNPALAPFLVSGIGEYTDQAIYDAWKKAVEDSDAFPDRMRAFIAALPRRESPALASGPWSVVYNNDDNGAFSEWWDVESATGSYRAFSEESAKRLCDILNAKQSPALAEAIARAEKAEAELEDCKDHTCSLQNQLNDSLNEELRLKAEIVTLKASNDNLRSKLEETSARLRKEESAHSDALWESREIKSAQLGILRPIAEMSPTVPEGCTMVFGSSDSNGVWDISDILSSAVDTHFALLRLPAAEATPPAVSEPAEEQAWIDPVCGCARSPDASKESPCPICKPAAQVPLGPEDCPPGSVFTFGAAAVWITPLCVSSDGVGFPDTEPNKPLIQRFSFDLLQEAAKINTSLPDTGRWDANAWRPCSKPGK